jgi:hypothetical protein
MTRTSAFVAAVAFALAALALAACGGSTDDLSLLTGTSSSPTVGASASATASPSPTVTATVTVTPSPSPSPSGSATDAGGGSPGGVTADELSAYLDDVRPSYDEIIAAEADMVDVIVAVEENRISLGQGARRLDRLGLRLDPPVTQLAVTTVPSALAEAHRAWLDSISFEARAFARLAELMADGTYQRGAVDSEYQSQMNDASAKWQMWERAVTSQSERLGVPVPWSWPGE